MKRTVSTLGLLAVFLLLAGFDNCSIFGNAGKDVTGPSGDGESVLITPSCFCEPTESPTTLSLICASTSTPPGHIDRCEFQLYNSAGASVCGLVTVNHRNTTSASASCRNLPPDQYTLEGNVFSDVVDQTPAQCSDTCQLTG